MAHPVPVTYERYRALGGVINSKDHADALLRAQSTGYISRPNLSQVQGMSENAGISMENDPCLDPRAVLYSVLRDDVAPPGTQHHHCRMYDQNLFAEVLRMYGDEESLRKLIICYPKINFFLTTDHPE